MINPKPNRRKDEDKYHFSYTIVDDKKYRVRKSKKTGETEILADSMWYSHSINDEPALILNNIAFWRHFGNTHREDDKPAIVWSDGYKHEWFINGKKHRWAKPAITYKDNSLKLYYIQDTNITREVETFIEHFPNDDLEIIFFEMSLKLKT